MNQVDIAVIVIAILGAINGFRKGFVRIIAGCLGMCGGVYIGSLFGRQLGEFVAIHVPTLEAYSLWAGFGLIFVGIYLGALVMGKVVEGMLGIVMLGPINRLFGMVVGMVCYLIFVGVTLIVMAPVFAQYPAFAGAYDTLWRLGF